MRIASLWLLVPTGWEPSGCSTSSESPGVSSPDPNVSEQSRETGLSDSDPLVPAIRLEDERDPGQPHVNAGEKVRRVAGRRNCAAPF